MTTTVIVKYSEGDVKEDSVTFHPHSAGGSRCGVKFNPEKNHRVRKLKALAAGLMEAIDEELQSASYAGDEEGCRCFRTAMTELESAQMFAVKGLFANRNAGKAD